MYTLLILVCALGATFVVGNALGWVVHTLMHTGWIPYLARSHTAHHTLYTPGDYLSETYRDAGWDDSALVFVPAIAIPILALIAGVWFLTGIWWICALMFVLGATVGYANVYAHGAFHIRGHFLYRFNWFRELSRLHVLHHIHPRKNQGIIWLGMDRLLGTYVSE